MPLKLKIIHKLVIVIGIFIIILSYFLFNFKSKTEGHILNAHENFLLVTSRGIATVLHNRVDFFNILRQKGLMDVYSPTVVNLDNVPIIIDGFSSDWGEGLKHSVSHGAESVLVERESYNRQSLTADVSFGIKNNFLYALFRIKDDNVVFRHKDFLRLDTSDHIRITTEDKNGYETRYLITASKPGSVSTYKADENWRYASDGVAVRKVRGMLNITSSGYAIELRMPLTLVSPTMKLRYSIVDVDDPNERRITLEMGHSSKFGLVSMYSPELNRILNNLDPDMSQYRVLILDKAGRKIADRGVASVLQQKSQPDKTNSAVFHNVVTKALLGKPEVDRDDNSSGYISASSPINADNKVIGAVVVQRSIENILNQESETLQTFPMQNFILFVGFSLFVLVFTIIQMRKIQKLEEEAETAIDKTGKVIKEKLGSYANSPDEIGDLSRRLTSNLQKLTQYQNYVKRIPKTLYHEIINPLNAISGAIQNLVIDKPELNNNKHIENTNRSIRRVAGITTSLGEANDLDTALANDEKENFDLANLVDNYVKLRNTNKENLFTFAKPDRQYNISGTAFRIEQLLDKLLDNAVDFSPNGNKVEIKLAYSENKAKLTVTNQGKLLPVEIKDQIFDYMVSVRKPSTDFHHDKKQHLGLGLAISKKIVLHHGGSIEADNLEDKSGVMISIMLPLEN